MLYPLFHICISNLLSINILLLILSSNCPHQIKSSKYGRLAYIRYRKRPLITLDTLKQRCRPGLLSRHSPDILEIVEIGNAKSHRIALNKVRLNLASQNTDFKILGNEAYTNNETKNLSNLINGCGFEGAIIGCPDCFVSLSIYSNLTLTMIKSGELIEMTPYTKPIPYFSEAQRGKGWLTFVLNYLQNRQDSHLFKLRDRIVKRNILNTSDTVDPNHHQQTHKYEIDIGVFMDVYAFENPRLYGDKAKALEYIYVTINVLNTLFHHPSLGSSIDLNIVGIYLLETQPSIMETDGQWSSYLEKFCIYQTIFNFKNTSKDGVATVKNFIDRPNKWDIGLLYTGIDIWSSSSTSTVGGANNGCLCTRSCCAIVEAGYHKGFGVQVETAHEIGHNLGFSHDSESSVRKCRYGGNFIMSAKLQKLDFWSPCCREVLTQNLPHYRCLIKNSTNAVNDTRNHQIPLGRLQNKSVHPSNDETIRTVIDISKYSMPGAWITLHQQCQAKFGSSSYAEGIRDTMSQSCYALSCNVMDLESETLNEYYSTTGMALAGSYCGNNSWCMQAMCTNIPHNLVPNRTNGNWGPWQPYQRCRQSCYPTGIFYETWIRMCNSPYPNFGGSGCSGSEKVPVQFAYLQCSEPLLKKCSQIKSLDGYKPNFCEQERKKRQFMITDKRIYDYEQCSLVCEIDKVGIAKSKGRGVHTYPYTGLPNGIPCNKEATKFCFKSKCVALKTETDLVPRFGKPSDLYSSGLLLPSNVPHDKIKLPPQPPKWLEELETSQKMEKQRDKMQIKIFTNRKLVILIASIATMGLTSTFLTYFLLSKRRQDYMEKFGPLGSNTFDSPGLQIPTEYMSGSLWWRRSVPGPSQADDEQTADTTQTSYEPAYNYDNHDASLYYQYYANREEEEENSQLYFNYTEKTT